MADNSIVRDGATVGNGMCAFDHTILDQSGFYPADMSALPTSTPNPANIRRKSRRSWFETTPKGCKFEIAVEKPVESKRPARRSETTEVLTLSHFSGAPRLDFGTLKVGQEKICTLLLRNPHDYDQTVKVEKIPEKKYFSVPLKEFVVGADDSYPLEITWSPKDVGGYREMLLMQIDGAYRVQAYVFGSVTAPPAQKKKGKRVGLLASKASRPFSVIHTSSLANINQQYSPEKKTRKKMIGSSNLKPVDACSQASKQPGARAVKAGTQSKAVNFQAQSKVTKHHNIIESTKGRKSSEGKRRSKRLSDKFVVAQGIAGSTEPSENVENIEPVEVSEEILKKTRKSTERKGSLPKPKIEENIPKKKMRRSNTYSNVSGIGLVVPIIHGETVKGHKDTSLIIEDCDISGVHVLEDSVTRTEEPHLEPSFLEPVEIGTQSTTYKKTEKHLEPSFLVDEGSIVSGGTLNIKGNDSLEPSFLIEEKTTVFRSNVKSDNLEPSFLECQETHTVAKSSVFTAVKKNEEFHDSLEADNISLEPTNFVQPKSTKGNNGKQSHRKRSGRIELEGNNKPTGVKLLRSAKRNNARTIVTQETFVKDVCPKLDNQIQHPADKHKPLNDSVGQSNILEQLKNLKSFVHDKSLEIEKSGNELDGKESMNELDRRETFVKCRQSQQFAVPGNDVNVRRETFVTESTKFKVLETQKPSEASPRRTTFTVLKGSERAKGYVESRLRDNANALHEEEEDAIEEHESHDNHMINEQRAEQDQIQKKTERLFSVDSLENDSFEKQTESPKEIFVEQKEEFDRRSTLTVTKSRPSDALLEHAQRSAAAVCLFDAVNAVETINEDVTENNNQTYVDKEPIQKSSQNSTFEIPSENTPDKVKDSSFPTTPYHLLPTSPHLDHSRRSTHIVEKPKVVDKSRIDRKELFCNQKNIDQNKNDYSDVPDCSTHAEVEHESSNSLKNNENSETVAKQAIQNEVLERHGKKQPETSTVNIENTGEDIGPGLNTRRRKLSARRSVTSLGRKSAEKLIAAHTSSGQSISGETELEKISLVEKESKDSVDDKANDEEQAKPVQDLFFVPFDSKPVLEAATRQQTKKPDPRHFLKKRSNPVTQEEKRPKRVKNDNTDARKTVGKGAKKEQQTFVKQSTAPPARVTRQTVRSVGLVKDVTTRQALKPKPAAVKGLAQSKLILSMKSKSVIPKHPLPFAAKNMFYDERWMEKQERGFVNWLNFILTPPEEHQGSDVKVKVDAGKLTLDVEKGRTKLAPTNEILSFRTYSAQRKLNRLRKAACRLFQSDSVRRVIQKIEGEVESKRLLVRKDKMLHADLGAKQKILDMLLSYNPLWLRVGLETIYGEVVPLQCNTDVYGLSRFIILRVLASPDIAEEYAHPTVPHLYRDGYAEATAQHTLKRFLMLVFFLDQAKQHRLMEHNPCLFCKNADIKTSKDLLLQFSRDYLSGEGDITRHLGYLGYKVTYSQTALDEFDFAVKTLASDLRDGLRLTRVLEIICSKPELSKSLRAPAISRLQKIHNVEVAFNMLTQQKIETGSVTTRDIVDGHRERTLSLLWMIILHYQVAMVINTEQIKEEIGILERSLKLKKQLHKLVNFETGSTSQRRDSEGPDLHTQDERLNLLMKWCRAVCAFYDIKIENFTVSFSDGRALCHILHYYHPGLLPLAQIQQETSMTHLENMEKNCQQNLNCSLNDSINCSAVFGDVEDPAVYEQLLANEKGNFKQLAEKVKELGGVPMMLRWSDMSNTIPDEKVVVTYLMYLCARLLDIRHESRAARVIQHAWRAHRLRKMEVEYKAKASAIVVIQRVVRAFLLRRREVRRQSAAVRIQSVWRGYMARKEVLRLHEERRLQQQIEAVKLVQTAVKRYLYRRRYLQMKSAVIQVQAYCRGYLLRKKLHTAATNIQRVFRGHMTRCRVEQMTQAAVTIQSAFRGCIVRKSLQKCNAAAKIIQYRYRAHLEMKKQQAVFTKAKHSCVTIQRFWREYVARQQVRQIKAAVTIQACYRGYVSRKHFEKFRDSVICIQAASRGFLQRLRFSRRKEAVVKIQRWFRDYLVAKQQRKEFLQIKNAVVVLQNRRKMVIQRRRYLLLSESALKIQSYARMLMQRQKFKNMKSAAVSVQTYYRAVLLGRAARKEFLISKGAAITIQAVFRGHLVRQEMGIIRSAATVIQSSFRCYSARKRFLAVKGAVCVCQQRYRAKKLGQQERENYARLRNAATTIQNRFRGVKCRGAYRIERENVIKVQSLVRMFLCRRQFSKIKWAISVIQGRFRAKQLGSSCRRQYLIKLGATITLQAGFRGLIRRRQYSKTRQKIILIQAAVRGHLQQNMYQKLKHSTIIVQRRLRETMVARQQRSKFIDMKKAAITIQAAWRMSQEKKRYAEMKKSAIIIQSHIRKFTQRKAYLKQRAATVVIQRRLRETMVATQQRLKFIQMKRAAITIQAVWRMTQDKKRYAELKKSAIIIQSHIRQFVQRTAYLKQRAATVVLQRRLRETMVARQQRLKFIDMKKAAITIQAVWRMTQDKQRYAEMKKSAIIIQSHIRKFTQHKSYLKQRAATVVIQRRLRETMVTRQQRLKFLNMKQAAITIQAAWRMTQDKKIYAEMKKSAIIIQSHIRQFVQHTAYLKQRAATVVIQRRLRETMVARQQRLKFINMKQAAITIQAAWRMTQDKKRYAEMKKSAIIIQSHIRQFMQHKAYLKQREATIVIQRRLRETMVARQQRSEFIRIKSAAIVIQSAWRMTHCRQEFLMMKSSAVVVQSTVRGFIVQKRYNKLKSAVKVIEKRYCAKVKGEGCRRHFLVCKGAAMTIQAAFRGHKVRKSLKEEQKAAVRIQAWCRGNVSRQQFIQLKNAAIICQRRYRAAMLTRKMVGRYVQVRNAVISIQAVFRGHVQRKQYLRKRASAVKIQSLMRRYMQQKRYQHIQGSVLKIQRRARESLLARQQRREFLKLRREAVILQSLWRMKLERQKFETSKQAAILIQSVVRRYIQQKKYQNMKIAVNTLQRHYRAKKLADSARREFLITKGAAMTIQAWFRGYLVREEIKREIVSSVTIQSAFRCYSQRRKFVQLKKAALVCQRRYRAVVIGKQERSQFERTKRAIITIQSAIRAWRCRQDFLKVRESAVKIQALHRMHMERQRYLKQKSAAVVIQKWFQGACLRNEARRQLLYHRGAAITIQANVRMYLIRKLYQQTIATRKHSAAVKIQSWYRGSRVCRNYRKQQWAAGVLQTRWRAELQCRKDVMHYHKLRDAVIAIQSMYRGKLARSALRKHKAAVKIQTIYRMAKQRKEFSRIKKAAVKVQAAVRCWLARRQLAAMKEQKLLVREQYLARVSKVVKVNMAAIVIQRCYRNHTMMRIAQERLHSILVIQRWMRSRLQRLHYLRNRKRVVCLQSHIRTWLAKRDRAARVIQVVARKWLGCTDVRKQNKAAVKLQALWKGFCLRKNIKSRRLTLLRKRVQAATASATEEKKLGNRTASALDYLLRFKQLSQVLDALLHLEVASRLSWTCCERMVDVNAVSVLYRLVKGCNRSLPHMEIIKCTISILTNLAKYEKTRSSVYETEGGVSTLVDLMQIYREKGQIFCKTCTLLGIIALDTPCKTSIVGDKKLIDRLRSMQTLTARKHKLEENQRVTRARMNASTLNATFMVQSPVKMQKIKPDWSLHKDKMGVIENPLKAINFVLGNLGVLANSRLKSDSER